MKANTEEEPPARRRDRVTKTQSLPDCQGYSESLSQIKHDNKKKYHSQKVKRHKINEERLNCSLDGKQKKSFRRRRFSLKSVGGRRHLNESCPDLENSDARIEESPTYNPEMNQVDSIDLNTLLLFRDLSIDEVDFIEINFD